MQEKIQPGTFCTCLFKGGSSQALEVIKIKDDKHITVRRLKATLTGKRIEQNYKLESNPNGITLDLHKTPNGKWKALHYNEQFILGKAIEYDASAIYLA